jgi:phosphoribosylanthranilate isomerase
MIVQIYEIQTPVEADQMIALGVDHVGSVLVSRTTWRQPLIRETVREVQAAGRVSSLIPLFSDFDGVARALDYYRPDIVHFCDALPVGAGTQGRLAAFVAGQQRVREAFPEIRIMRSIPVPPDGRGRSADILSLAAAFEAVSDYFLTDTLLAPEADSAGDQEPVTGFVGITGRTCNWEIARRLVSATPLPVILAGGLSPQNVVGGIRRVQPAGVDSCTLTNAAGPDGQPVRFEKDRHKVHRFVSLARGAAAQTALVEACNPHGVGDAPPPLQNCPDAAGPN